MGEARRRELLRAAGKHIADAANPIEQAWRDFSSAAIARDAPPIQLAEMRKAFYAGAAMIFEAIVHGLDPEREPTEADMQRMNRISAAVEHFAGELAASMRPEGTA